MRGMFRLIKSCVFWNARALGELPCESEKLGVNALLIAVLGIAFPGGSGNFVAAAGGVADFGATNGTCC
jgi:hypothetical protein